MRPSAQSSAIQIPYFTAEHTTFNSMVSKFSPIDCIDWKSATDFQGPPLFTHSYEYHFACQEALNHQKPEPSLRYTAVKKEGFTPVFIVLEHARKTFGGLPYSILSSPQSIYVPYWDLSIPKDDTSNAITPALDALLDPENVGQWDVMRLSNVLEGTAILKALESQSTFSWRKFPAPPCDYLNCSNSDTFLSGISKNFRASLRKARNKLSAHSDVRFESHTTKCEITTALENFFSLEARGWKGASSGAISQDSGIKRFYELLFEHFTRTPRQWVEINELWVDGNLLASQLCLGVADTLFVLKIAYDETQPKLSPGNMLLEWLITRGDGNGRARYLNLISDSSWHRDWAASQIANWHIEAYNRTAGGRTIQLARFIQNKMQHRNPTHKSIAAKG